MRGRIEEGEDQGKQKEMVVRNVYKIPLFSPNFSYLLNLCFVILFCSLSESLFYSRSFRSVNEPTC